MASFVAEKTCAFIDYNTDPNVIATSTKAFLMAPGLGDLKEEYRFIGPKLATQYPDHRVIAMDLRGLGGSDVGFASYNCDDIGRDVVALIKRLNIKEVILVGCSISGAAMVYATAESITKPEEADYKVKGVIFLAPFCWEHPKSPIIPVLLFFLMSDLIGPSFWSNHYAHLYTPEKPVSDLTEYVAKLKLNLNERGRTRALYGLTLGSKEACAARIPEIPADFPMLAVYGTKDPDFPNLTKELTDLKQKMPQITDKDILIIENGGHYPQVDAVEDVFQRIVQYLTPILG